MMSSSEYLLLESECSFTKYVSSCPTTKYLYLRLPFLKMDNTGESVFQFAGEVWLYKEWKNQKTWCLLHGWKLEM